MSRKLSKKELERKIKKVDAAIAGDKSEDTIATLKQALDYDWPEIQRHLYEEGRKKNKYQKDEKGREYFFDERGRKVIVMNVDEWWLKDFKREDVIMTLPGIVLMNTKPWHVRSVCISLRDAYGIGRDADRLGASDNDNSEDCFDTDDILAHIERFPQGQFAAQLISGPNAGNCAGMAVTMRTSRPPTAPILPWREAIGDMQLRAHEDDGDWLYGVEMAVHGMYRRRGIGSGLYQARFQLAKALNLRGWYAVGMLMGYHQYADRMPAREYGERVIAGEIKDPTVSLQLKLGFRAAGVISDYCDEPAAGDTGILIVWENPDYQPEPAR